MDKDKTDNAFDLSDEDFDNMLVDSQNTDVNAVEDDTVNITDTTDASSTDVDIDEDDSTDVDLDDISTDLDLDETDSTIAPQMVELVHKGKTVTVSMQDAINLAQKGYDYEDKTAKLAPHRRLVKLVEEDEELQDVINSYVTSKTTGDLPKRDDFENEDEWLAASVNKAVSNIAPFTTGKAETEVDTDTTIVSTTEAPIVTKLRGLDPQNFDKIAPHFIAAAKQLTVEQYQQISTSEANVIKLYDIVKNRVLKGPTSSSSTGLNGKQKTFNLRSNRTTSGKRAPKKNVWDLSNKEFDKQLQRAKGY